MDTTLLRNFTIIGENVSKLLLYTYCVQQKFVYLCYPCTLAYFYVQTVTVLLSFFVCRILIMITCLHVASVLVSDPDNCPVTAHANKVLQIKTLAPQCPHHNVFRRFNY